MHSDEMEDIAEATMRGYRCTLWCGLSLGRHVTDGTSVCMTSMFVPDPVIQYTIHTDSKAAQNLSKALQRFSKETLRSVFGRTLKQATPSLLVWASCTWMYTSSGCGVSTKYPLKQSPPRVSYRGLSRLAPISTIRIRSRPVVRVSMAVWRDSLSEMKKAISFTDNIVGGVIPREFISSCEKGFKSMMEKGQLIGAPLVNVITINDGVHQLTLLMSRSREACRGAWATGEGQPVYPRAHYEG